MDEMKTSFQRIKPKHQQLKVSLLKNANMSKSDYLIKDIENVITGIDGEIKKIDISRLTAPGENFISLVFRVDVQVEKDGKVETVHAVAKRLPTVIKMDLNAIAMRHEIKWYSEIAPLIKEFGQEYGIDTDFYPECLGTRLSMDSAKTNADEESVLLLKNINPDGFENLDRHIGFDYRTAKAFLRTLATFHSIPLVIKFKKPEHFKIIKQCLNSILDDAAVLSPPKDKPPSGPDGKTGGPPNNHPSPGITYGKMLEIPACQPYRAKIKAMKEANKEMGDFLFSPADEPWATMVHNDSWVNNIMVKLRGEEEPLVKMVDFQVCTYSSFAKDLVLFLLTSVQDDVQREHFDDLLRYYYDQLTSKLEKFNIPELKLSYSDYLKELEKVAQAGEMAHAIFFTNPVFSEKGKAPDFLAGEADMAESMHLMMNNMGERQKQKLALIMELAVQRNWA
ncbi:uncharacterized protein LOC109543987 isoform X1 [Dendroctonus ponderosae]|nr:uncharacterized protein LOC109543987 isoform X1 [Dendroctonus ponderosae]KAH1021149.1 hypothetical protein HUJ04_010699 [Dendroctonus ponderosae]KAH1021150.1 hypothetical protein HUJ04_010699 [Dendroctonus ponderosae]